MACLFIDSIRMSIDQHDFSVFSFILLSQEHSIYRTHTSCAPPQDCDSSPASCAASSASPAGEKSRIPVLPQKVLVEVVRRLPI